MQLKIKRLHPDAVLPAYAKPGDSGLDLCAVEDVVLMPGVPTLVRTGIAVELPQGGDFALVELHEEHVVSDEDGVILMPEWVAAKKVPVTFEAQIRPRSGLALKHGVTVVNSPGTVDNGYRGEIGVILRWDGHAPNAWSGTHFDSELETYSACYLTAKEMIEDPSYLRSSPCHEAYKIRKGERIAQMVIAPVTRCEVVEVEELSGTDRGDGGFGSTGK